MITITRESDDRFSLTTDVMLADGTLKSDDDMRLSNDVLQSHEERGHIRIGGLMRVTLGPKAYAAVTALKVGETVTFPAPRRFQ